MYSFFPSSNYYVGCPKTKSLFPHSSKKVTRWGVEFQGTLLVCHLKEVCKKRDHRCSFHLAIAEEVEWWTGREELSKDLCWKLSQRKVKHSLQKIFPQSEGVSYAFLLWIECLPPCVRVTSSFRRRLMWQVHGNRKANAFEGTLSGQ